MRAWMRTARDGGRHGCSPARSSCRPRHRRLRGQRPARRRHRRRRRARPVPLAGRPRRRRLRVHEHLAGRLVPRLRRVATSSGSASRRWTRSRAGRASTRSSSGGATCCGPGEQVRPRRQATRRRPRGRRREGRRGARLGRAGAAGTGPRALGRASWRPGAHPVSRASCASRPTARPIVLVGTTEMGQGPRTAFAQIAAQELGHRHGARAWCRAPTRRSPPTTAPPARAARRRSRGSPCSARRPTCAADAARDGVRRARARARRARACATARCRTASASSTTPSSSRRASGFSGGELIGDGEVQPERAPARTPRARSSGRSASAAAEVEVDRDTGEVRVVRHGDRRRRRQGDQPAARASARTRAPRCRASATRSSRRCSSRTGCS